MQFTASGSLVPYFLIEIRFSGIVPTSPKKSDPNILKITMRKGEATGQNIAHVSLEVGMS